MLKKNQLGVKNHWFLFSNMGIRPMFVSAVCTTALAGIAQLVEHLICNQRVRGSSPCAGTTNLL